MGGRPPSPWHGHGAAPWAGSLPGEADHPHRLMIVFEKLFSSLNPKISVGIKHQSSACQQGFLLGALAVSV